MFDPQDNSQIDNNGYFSYANESRQLRLRGDQERVRVQTQCFHLQLQGSSPCGMPLSLAHLSTSFPRIPLFLGNQGPVLPTVMRECYSDSKSGESLSGVPTSYFPSRFFIPAEHFRTAVNVLTSERVTLDE